MRNRMSSGRKPLATTRRHQARRDTSSRRFQVLTTVLALICALALFSEATDAAPTTDPDQLIAEARRLREQDPSMALLQKKTQQVEDEIVADWNAERYDQWARGHLRKLACCLHAQHWAYHLRLREGSHPETPKKTSEVKTLQAWLARDNMHVLRERLTAGTGGPGPWRDLYRYYGYEVSVSGGSFSFGDDAPEVTRAPSLSRPIAFGTTQSATPPRLDPGCELRYTWTQMDGPEGVDELTFTPNPVAQRQSASVIFPAAGPYRLEVYANTDPLMRWELPVGRLRFVNTAGDTVTYMQPFDGAPGLKLEEIRLTDLALDGEADQISGNLALEGVAADAFSPIRKLSIDGSAVPLSGARSADGLFKTPFSEQQIPLTVAEGETSAVSLSVRNVFGAESVRRISIEVGTYSKAQKARIGSLESRIESYRRLADRIGEIIENMSPWMRFFFQDYLERVREMILDLTGRLDQLKDRRIGEGITLTHNAGRLEATPIPPARRFTIESADPEGDPSVTLSRELYTPEHPEGVSELKLSEIPDQIVLVELDEDTSVPAGPIVPHMRVEVGEALSATAGASPAALFTADVDLQIGALPRNRELEPGLVLPTADELSDNKLILKAAAGGPGWTGTWNIQTPPGAAVVPAGSAGEIVLGEGTGKTDLQEIALNVSITGEVESGTVTAGFDPSGELRAEGSDAVRVSVELEASTEAITGAKITRGGASIGDEASWRFGATDGPLSFGAEAETLTGVPDSYIEWSFQWRERGAEEWNDADTDKTGKTVLFDPLQLPGPGAYEIKATARGTKNPDDTASDTDTVYLIELDLQMQGLSEATETDPGAFVAINDNDNAGQEGAADIEEEDLADADPDLQPLRLALEAVPDAGKVTLEVPEGIKVWKDDRKSEELTARQWDLSSEQQQFNTLAASDLYVEGRRLGRAGEIVLRYKDTGLSFQDKVRVTVVGVRIASFAQGGRPKYLFADADYATSLRFQLLGLDSEQCGLLSVKPAFYVKGKERFHNKVELVERTVGVENSAAVGDNDPQGADEALRAVRDPDKFEETEHGYVYESYIRSGEYAEIDIDSSKDAPKRKDLPFGVGNTTKDVYFRVAATIRVGKVQIRTESDAEGASVKQFADGDIPAVDIPISYDADADYQPLPKKALFTVKPTQQFVGVADLYKTNVSLDGYSWKEIWEPYKANSDNIWIWPTLPQYHYTLEKPKGTTFGTGDGHLFKSATAGSLDGYCAAQLIIRKKTLGAIQHPYKPTVRAESYPRREGCGVCISYGGKNGRVQARPVQNKLFELWI